MRNLTVMFYRGGKVAASRKIIKMYIYEQSQEFVVFLLLKHFLCFKTVLTLIDNVASSHC